MTEESRTVTIYDTVPDGLITVAEAARIYRVSNAAIYRWIRQGRLSEAGVLRVSPSGHKNVALLESHLVERAASKDQDTQTHIYHETPGHLITFSDAVSRYRIKVSTLRSWVARGYIIQRGKLRDGPGRAKSLLDPRDLERMLSNHHG